jgi:hypothetical protein
MLRAEHVQVPLVNAFSEYDRVRAELQGKIHGAAKNIIFVFCASLPAKSWIAELLGFAPNISCIDAGSAFDPLFVGQTRSDQLPMDLLVWEYRDWLEEREESAQVFRSAEEWQQSRRKQAGGV